MNNLFWLCQSPEYAWSLYMFNRLLKMPQVVNVAGFWIWQDYARIMQESEYSSICLYNAWTCLNCFIMPEKGWTCLNMPELTVLTIPTFSICLIILDIWQGFKYASCIKYERVLNIPQHSYNIIIVTNVVILGFLSARFVYCSATNYFIF